MVRERKFGAPAEGDLEDYADNLGRRDSAVHSGEDIESLVEFAARHGRFARFKGGRSSLRQ